MESTTRRLARWATRVLAAWLLAQVPALAAAQDTVRFEAAEQLPGYTEARASEYASLYSFGEFDRWNGQTLAADELRGILQRWKEERARVAAEVERLRADPREAALYFLRKKLEAHPFFVKVRLVEFPTHDPYVFLIQAPRVPTPGYEEGIIDLYGPALLELEQVFRAEVAEPLELERHERRPSGFVIVLTDRDEYRKYVRRLPGPALFFAQAHFDRELGAVVTYTDPEARRLSKRLARRPVLHEMVHGLQAAYATTDERLPRRPWFDEGLASLVSSRVGLEARAGAKAGGEGDGPADELAVRAIGELTRRPDFHTVYRLPLDELTALASYEEAYDRMGQRAVGAGAEADYSVALLALYAQGCTWAHFLAVSDDGRLRDGWLRYVRASLAGRPGPGALRTAFGEGILPELDARYGEYLGSGADTWMAADRRDADLEASFQLSAQTAAELERSARERGAGIEALTPDATRPEIRFALALWKARQGAYSAALRDMEALAAYADAGPFLERVERERVRLAAMIDLRRRFLEHLMENDTKLKLTVGDQRLLADVEEVRADEVRLGPNRLEMERLALDEMDGMQLVRAMKERRTGFPKHWLFAYPYVLSGDDGWRRLLSDGDPEQVALQEDAADDYPRRLRLAKVANELTDLAQAEPPASAEEGRAVVARVAALFAEYGDLDLVARRRAPLIKLAYRGQSAVFDEEGLGSATNARLELLDEGRVRLTYDFEDPAQGRDFSPTEYLSEQRWPDAIPPSDSIAFHVEDGALQGFGSIVSRHNLEFEGPQRVLMRLLYRAPKRPYDTRIRTLLGICDDGHGGFITTDSQGGLSLSASQRSALIQAPAEGLIFMDTEHEIVIEHDGEAKVVTTKDGEFASEIRCGPRLSGSVFLWSTSDCQVEILDLVIEARISSSSLRVARVEWIETELRKQGIE